MIFENKSLISLVVAFACTTTAVAASAKKTGPAAEELKFSANASFTPLQSSRADPAFNNEIFMEQVRSGLNRAGINVDANKPGKLNLQFDVDYGFFPAESAYRVMAIRISTRNNLGHAICDISSTSWWIGPSGARQVVTASEQAIDYFFQRCIK